MPTLSMQGFDRGLLHGESNEKKVATALTIPYSQDCFNAVARASHVVLFLMQQEVNILCLMTFLF